MSTPFTAFTLLFNQKKNKFKNSGFLSSVKQLPQSSLKKYVVLL